MSYPANASTRPLLFVSPCSQPTSKYGGFTWSARWLPAGVTLRNSSEVVAYTTAPGFGSPSLATAVIRVIDFASFRRSHKARLASSVAATLPKNFMPSSVGTVWKRLSSPRNRASGTGGNFRSDTGRISSTAVPVQPSSSGRPGVPPKLASPPIITNPAPFLVTCSFSFSGRRGSTARNCFADTFPRIMTSYAFESKSNSSRSEGDGASSPCRNASATSNRLSPCRARRSCAFSGRSRSTSRMRTPSFDTVR